MEAQSQKGRTNRERANLIIARTATIAAALGLTFYVSHNEAKSEILRSREESFLQDKGMQLANHVLEQQTRITQSINANAKTEREKQLGLILLGSILRQENDEAKQAIGDSVSQIGNARMPSQADVDKLNGTLDKQVISIERKADNEIRYDFGNLASPDK